MSHTRAVLQTGDNSGVTSECVALHVEASKFVGCHIIAYIFVCVLHCKFLKAIKTIHFLITFMVGSQTSTDSIKRNSRGFKRNSSFQTSSSSCYPRTVCGKYRLELFVCLFKKLCQY